MARAAARAAAAGRGELSRFLKVGVWDGAGRCLGSARREWGWVG